MTTQNQKPHQAGDDALAKRTAEQNAQARLVLIQLLWLAVILLIASIAWLANTQKELALHVEERLKITETFNARMNDMDDRLFAIDTSDDKVTHTLDAKNDLRLVVIQLTLADRLYQRGDYQESTEILQLLEWQLSSQKLALASPLKSTLKTTLKDDLSHLESMQTQTDAWQADIITMRSVQSYLSGIGTSNPPTPKDLALHDAKLLLSLAVGAASLRERETLVLYLNDIVQALEKTQALDSKPASQNTDTVANADVHDIKTIDSLDKAIYALNTLLANPPALPPLKSREILKNY